MFCLCMHEFSSGYSDFLSQSKDKQVRSSGYSNVPIGVSVSANGIQGVPRLAPQSKMGLALASLQPAKDMQYRNQLIKSSMIVTIINILRNSPGIPQNMNRNYFCTLKLADIYTYTCSCKIFWKITDVTIIVMSCVKL